MSAKEFMREMKNSSRVEGELLETVFISLVASALTVGILYIVRLRSIGGVLDQYGFYIFFAVLSYALLLPSIRQVRAFKRFTCMTGMMIGMTIGMMAGFLTGFYIGATNGMFYGGVFGMAIGIWLGVTNGRCCGIMGTLEGLMAGFMGGLMGAMTAVMMYNDNLKAAGVLMFMVCGAILCGLNYMLYIETKSEERQVIEDHFRTILISIVLTAITVWMMVFGPKSPLFA